jgi:hypothetical protein
MKYYTPEASIPAAAITYAGNLSPYQPILFTTQFGYTDIGLCKEGDDPFKGRPLVWTISYIKVTLVRDWSTSIASIVLTSSIPSADCPVPKLPNLGKIRGGNNPYLTFEDEIRIYMGYIGDVNTPINASMLDEHPIDLCPRDIPDVAEGLKCGPKHGEDFKQNDSKPLAPVFWGFIDNISMVGDSKSGVKLMIQCRDRTRVLSDTKIIAIPELQGRLVDSRDKGFFKKKGSGGLASGRREDILIQVARAATGSLFASTAGQGQTTFGPPGTKQCWKPVIGGSDDNQENWYYPHWGPKIPEGTPQSQRPSRLGVQLFTGFVGEDKYLTKISPDEDPALWLREATHKKMLPYSEPRFHMWVQRPPLSKANGAAVFQILNKSPIEIIQFLANTEERPTDFFASHINGDYIFGPRVLDTSGFYDPVRMHRTYFFKEYPKDVGKPKVNQMILRIRTASSSLASFNRFVVMDSESEGAYDAFLDKLSIALEVLPWTLDGNVNDEYGSLFPDTGGRAIYPPCRNQIIYDGNLSSYGPDPFNRVGGALIVGISQARTWAREMQGVQITLTGDPTFYPSEAIRVYNTVLHDYATSINPGTDYSEKLLEKNQRQIEGLFKDEPTISNIMDPSNKKGVQDFSSQQAKTVTQIMTDNTRGHMVNTEKDPAKGMILPVYKVRSVQHVLKTSGTGAGFITTIECIGDY